MSGMDDNGAVTFAGERLEEVVTKAGEALEQDDRAVGHLLEARGFADLRAIVGTHPYANRTSELRSAAHLVRAGGVGHRLARLQRQHGDARTNERHLPGQLADVRRLAPGPGGRGSAIGPDRAGGAGAVAHTHGVTCRRPARATCGPYICVMSCMSLNTQVSPASTRSPHCR